MYLKRSGAGGLCGRQAFPSSISEAYGGTHERRGKGCTGSARRTPGHGCGALGDGGETSNHQTIHRRLLGRTTEIHEPAHIHRPLRRNGPRQDQTYRPVSGRWAARRAANRSAEAGAIFGFFHRRRGSGIPRRVRCTFAYTRCTAQVQSRPC